MAEKSFPFNSVSGDRKYSATDWATYFGSILTNGVFPSGDKLLVSAASGMAVSVSAGMGCINGYWYQNTAALQLSITAADGVLNRIDAIVLRWHRVNRSITLAVKQGTAASTAAAPTMQRDADIWELCIAQVSVAAGVTAITTAMITDKRADEDVCGFVSSLITPETGDWFAQFEAMFDEWFETIQDTLGDDVAGNLASLITTHTSDDDIHVTATQKTAWSGKSTTATYTATLSTSGWSASAPYTQTVTVTGIVATDNPIVDIVLSGTASTDKARLKSWGRVSRIVTAANQITAMCLEDKPDVDMTIQLKVVR